MRKLLIPLTLAMGVAATGAFAATATGTISEINATTGWVTLTNGARYDFSNASDHQAMLANFKTGDKVTIDYAEVGTGMDGNTISPAM